MSALFTESGKQTFNKISDDTLIQYDCWGAPTPILKVEAYCAKGSRMGQAFESTVLVSWRKKPIPTGHIHVAKERSSLERT